MITLALLALVASVLVWAAPSSQAQANLPPIANAGTDDLVKAAQAKAADARTGEETALLKELSDLQAKKANADRYTNALATECRALGTQDFGDKASDLARDACAPSSGPTGRPLS